MSHKSNSFEQIVSRLRVDFPGVKLLALGQTIYWDEPMKAILRRALDKDYPEAVMAVGIHDADYFSKISTNRDIPEGWSIVAHNDGVTKDLWVATGEISRLFGSETVPTRDLLASYGAQFDKIARDYTGGREALMETATSAWGWRGLIHRDSSDEVSRDILLKDSLPHLIDLLEWGFSRTIDSLAEQAAQERAKFEARLLIVEVKSYAAEHPNASITDVFRDLIPSFYSRLLGYQPQNLELTSVTEVFKFNRSTADLPRFNLLRAFLNPQTREACQESYDLALENADTYTLDKFCPGAIPFDLVIPGKGRGTVCIEDGCVSIDLDEPIVLTCDKTPSSPLELAELIENRLGASTSLIGKARTLVLMMASEFIFVLHEEASTYVPYSEKMATLMKERGVDLSFYPILRMNYHTWDALSECDVMFQLPGHLAAAFGQGEITSTEFADSWRGAVKEQDDLLQCLTSLPTTEELLIRLAAKHPETWEERLLSYRNAVAAIKELSERMEPLKAESVSLRDSSHQIKQSVQATEAEKGEHFRNEIKARRDALYALEADGKSSSADAQRLKKEIDEQEKVRETLQAAIEQKRGEARKAHDWSLVLKNQVQAMERGEEVVRARETVKSVEYETELARLWLIRDALLVSTGLKFTQHRPTAWWFLLTDPELKWFSRVAETTEYRFEEITTL